MKKVKRLIRGIGKDARIVCPDCPVEVGKNKDYGIRGDNYFFAAKCPKCKARVEWLTDQDFKLL